MYTGLVAGKGTIFKSDRYADYTELFIGCVGQEWRNTNRGASVLFSGVCLSVVEVITDKLAEFNVSDACNYSCVFRVQLSTHTTQITTAQYWQVGMELNIESSLKTGDTLDGHFVGGHVDGVAQVKSVDKTPDGAKISFILPKELAKYVCLRGSVSVDGVSLTVSHLQKNDFTVTLIPITLAETTLSALKLGDYVNIEVDMLAKIVDRLLKFQ